MSRALCVLLLTGLFRLGGQTACTGVQLLADPNAVNVSIGADGGTLTLALVAAGPEAGCAWTASTTVPWVEVLTPSGTLPGPLVLRFAANTGTMRVANRVLFANQSLLFTQNGPVCENPLLQADGVFIPKFSPLGGSFRGMLSFPGAAGGCEWTATPFGPTVLTTAESGVGMARLTFTVGRNCTSETRVGGVRVNLSMVSYFQQPDLWMRSYVVVAPGAVVFRSSGTQTVTVTSSEPLCPEMPFTVSSGGAGWLRVGVPEGGTPREVTLTADTTGLAPGAYSTWVGFAREGGTAVATVDVRLEVAAAPLRATPGAVRLGSDRDVETVTLDGGEVARGVRSVSRPEWLGYAVWGRVVKFGAARRGMMPGAYAATVVVADFAGNEVAIPVVLEVREPGGEEETEFAVSTEDIRVEVEEGGAAVERVVEVTSNRAATVTATVEPRELRWLTVTAAPMAVRVRVDPAAMRAGSYQGVVMVTGAERTRTIRVWLAVTERVRLLPGRTEVTLPMTGPLYLTASGRAVRFKATVDSAWLTVTPSAGRTPVNLELRAVAAPLEGGTALLKLESDEAVNSPVVVPVRMSGAAPVVAAVWDALAMRPGPASPGSLIRVHGVNFATEMRVARAVPLPRELGGTMVLVNGEPVPLFSAGPGEILAQVPMETALGVATVAVRTLGGVSAVTSLAVMGASPAFMWDGEPMGPGRVTMIYAHGLGALRPAMMTGAAGVAGALCQKPVGVTIGGVPARVTYAGVAPGLVGMMQVNFLAPALADGTYAMEVSAGGFVSQEVMVRVGH
jgi:uncharacterized protein (TIGR03437 family)